MGDVDGPDGANTVLGLKDGCSWPRAVCWRSLTLSVGAGSRRTGRSLPEVRCSARLRAPPKRGMPDEVRQDCDGRADSSSGTKTWRSPATPARFGRAKLRVGAHACGARRFERINEDSIRAHITCWAPCSAPRGRQSAESHCFTWSRAEKLFIEIGTVGRPDREEVAVVVVYHRTHFCESWSTCTAKWITTRRRSRYVEALRETAWSSTTSPLKSWPLMKLKRFDEARQHR